MATSSWMSKVTHSAPRGVDLRATPDGFVITWAASRNWRAGLAPLGFGLSLLLIAGSPRTNGPQVWFGEASRITVPAIILVVIGVALFAAERLRQAASSLSVTATHVRAAGPGAAHPGSMPLVALSGVVCGERIGGKRDRGVGGALTFLSGQWNAENDLIMISTLYAVDRKKEGQPLFHSLPSKQVGAWVEHVFDKWLADRTPPQDDGDGA